MILTNYLFNFLSAELNFFHTRPQAKINFTLKKFMSTKFYPKLALVLMVKEPSEASLHKLKGALNYAEQSEVQVFHKDQ